MLHGCALSHVHVPLYERLKGPFIRPPQSLASCSITRHSPHGPSQPGWPVAYSPARALVGVSPIHWADVGGIVTAAEETAFSIREWDVEWQGMGWLQGALVWGFHLGAGHWPPAAGVAEVQCHCLPPWPGGWRPLAVGACLQRMGEKEREVEELQRQLQERDGERQLLQEQVEAEQVEMRRWMAEAEQRERAMEELQQSIGERESAAMALEQQVAERAAEVQQLEEAVAQGHAEVERLQGQLVGSSHEVEELQRRVESHVAEVARLQGELEEQHQLQSHPGAHHGGRGVHCDGGRGALGRATTIDGPVNPMDNAI